MAHKKTKKTMEKIKSVEESKDIPQKPYKNLFSTNNILIVLLVLSVSVAAYLYIQLNKTNTSINPAIIGGVIGVNGSQDTSQYGTVKLDFYVMSQCPYGTQVEDAIKPVLDKFGNSVKFTLNYIASENPSGGFTSMHGQAEVDGDIMQLCAAKHYPDKYMSLIVCQNKNAGDIQNNWKSCAAEVGLDASTLETCFKGDEGKQLMSASIKASTAANARGSPTIYVNGKPYQGGRDSLSFTRVLCAGLGNHPECANIPACAADKDCTAQPNKDGRCVNPGQKDAKCEYSDPIPIDMIVLNAVECSSCDPSSIVDVTKRMFLGVKVRNVEYNTGEGKALAEKYGIKMLPAYLFDSNVTKSPSYAQVQRALVKVDDKYMIHPQAAGSNYNPTLAEIPRKLDLFVMSQCPYGVAAEKNLKSVLELFGNKINFTLRFIADQNVNGSFSSMHGQAEVDEDLRQVCAMKYYPDKYFNYILCIDEDYKNAGSIWESCAQKSGLDVSTIKTCSTGDEGKTLLSENIKLSGELGVGSSPTFLVNGKQQVTGALPPNTIKESVCKANAGLEGCDKTLEGGSSTPTSSGGCG